MKKFTLSFALSAMMMTFALDASAEATLDVATFDDLELAPESHKPGNNTAEEDKMTHFFSGEFKFNTYAYAEWQTWAFCGYSNETSTTFADMTTDQFRNVVGSGVSGSENYGVIYASTYMGYTTVEFADTNKVATIDGMYVTNNAWAAKSILQGDGAAPAFIDGDSLMIVTFGINGEDTTVVKTYLADYTSTDASDHYMLDTWQWVDLSSLGDVEKVHFFVIGSQNGIYGLNTPQYFALDDFGASRPDRAVVAQTVSEDDATISLVALTALNPADGAILYTVVESNGAANHTAVENAGTLTCTFDNVGDSATVIVKAYQKGKADYMEIPVTRTTSTGTDATSVDVVMYSSNGNIYIEGVEGEYSVDIFTATGAMVYSVDGAVDADCIYVGVDNKVLIVRVMTANGVTTQCVMMK